MSRWMASASTNVASTQRTVERVRRFSHPTTQPVQRKTGTPSGIPFLASIKVDPSIHQKTAADRSHWLRVTVLGGSTAVQFRLVSLALELSSALSSEFSLKCIAFSLPLKMLYRNNTPPGKCRCSHLLGSKAKTPWAEAQWKVHQHHSVLNSNSGPTDHCLFPRITFLSKEWVSPTDHLDPVSRCYVSRRTVRVSSRWSSGVSHICVCICKSTHAHIHMYISKHTNTYSVPSES